MNVEYVPDSETIPDITLTQTTSASLRTVNAILLALVLLAGFILNFIVIITVITNKKLREPVIHLMLCHHCLIQIFDLFFSIFFSLLYVANDSWVMGNGWCRVNAAMQQFCQLYTLLNLMIMAAERAVGLVVMYPGYDVSRAETVFNRKTLAGMLGVLVTVCIGMSVPILTVAIPVRPFKNRYICGIDANCPLGFSIVRIVIFTGCLLVQLVCVGAIFKKREEQSLPSQSQHVSDFIKKNRAMQDFVSRARLVVFLLAVFIIVEGPYIILSFIYEMANSPELTGGIDMTFPEDLDILTTYLRFFFPLISPIIVLSWCSDIWLRVKELVCCRSYDPPTIGQYFGAANNGVMTLVATPEGLQLRLPQQAAPLFQGQSTPTYSNPVAVPITSQREPSPDAETLTANSNQLRTSNRSLRSTRSNNSNRSLRSIRSNNAAESQSPSRSRQPAAPARRSEIPRATGSTGPSGSSQPGNSRAAQPKASTRRNNTNITATKKKKKPQQRWK